jgi:hypothetical protein
VEALSTGSWLTLERVRAAAVLCGFASLASLVWLFGFGHGTLDPLGRPLGTDFSNVWSAGRMALDGRAADAWDWSKEFVVQQRLHSKVDVDFYGWHYPPPFLLVASLLATMPYLMALIVWQASTLGGFAWMMRRFVPRKETLPLVLAAPVTLVCLTHGHNGFLTALLLGGGLILLERRPVAAGLLLGCLIYKPQFAVVIPPLLLVTRNWRAIGAAIVSSGILVGLTFALWGWPVWQAFIDSLPLTRDVVIEQGRTGWYKIMSPFAAVRMWGGGLALSYAIQGLATALATASVLFLSLRDNRALRNAAVTAAALLSTPYVLDYDAVVLGVGLAFLWHDGEESGFLPWDRTLMALVWIVPLFAREIGSLAYLPIGVIPPLLVLSLAVRRSLVRASPFRRSRAAFGR